MDGVAVILIAHGSRVKDVADELNAIVERVKKFVDIDPNRIYLAYNGEREGIDIPDWRKILLDLADQGIDKVVLVPLFIAKGVHVIKDIMSEFNSQVELNKWSKVVWRGKSMYIYISTPLSDSTLISLATANKVNTALRRLGYVKPFELVVDGFEIERISMSMIERYLEEVYGVDDKFKKTVIAKAVLASGNLDLASHVYIHDEFVDVAKDVLLNEKTPVVADVNMTYAGLKWRNKYIFIDDDETQRIALEMKITRAAASMIIAVERLGLFIPVIGNAPTALAKVIEFIEGGKEVPLVVATPPGFVNSVKVKEKLISTNVPCIVVRGTLGGSSIAVAIFNSVVDYVRS